MYCFLGRFFFLQYIHVGGKLLENYMLCWILLHICMQRRTNGATFERECCVLTGHLAREWFCSLRSFNTFNTFNLKQCHTGTTSQTQNTKPAASRQLSITVKQASSQLTQTVLGPFLTPVHHCPTPHTSPHLPLFNQNNLCK